MSSLYVRDTVRAWLAAGAVPFYDTVNQEQQPRDALWKTVDWGFPSRERDTYCGQQLENGTIAIAYFGQPGTGDTDVLAQAEQDIAALMAQVDPTNALVLEKNDPPFDYRQGNLYVVEFQVEYNYRS
jgi:hypothetical protein